MLLFSIRKPCGNFKKKKNTYSAMSAGQSRVIFVQIKNNIRFFSCKTEAIKSFESVLTTLQLRWIFFLQMKKITLWCNLPYLYVESFFYKRIYVGSCVRHQMPPLKIDYTICYNLLWVINNLNYCPNYIIYTCK